MQEIWPEGSESLSLNNNILHILCDGIGDQNIHCCGVGAAAPVASSSSSSSVDEQQQAAELSTHSSSMHGRYVTKVIHSFVRGLVAQDVGILLPPLLMHEDHTEFY